MDELEELRQQIDELRDLLEAARRDRWAGGTMLRGAAPVMPQVTALPTASQEYAYALLAVPGTPDVSYQCLRNAGGAWGWRTVATG